VALALSLTMLALVVLFVLYLLASSYVKENTRKNSEENEILSKDKVSNSDRKLKQKEANQNKKNQNQ